MRGEHPVNDGSTNSIWGSSPHARGTRAQATRSWQVPGIIPACAGNTYDSPEIADTSWDHPRMRGEHELSMFSVVSALGSSPHARGTPRCHFEQVWNIGIIPACAGNTLV